MKPSKDYVPILYLNKLFFTLLFFVFLGYFFLVESSLAQDNLRKAEKSFRDWSVFISKEEPKMCFIASQSIKGEAFRNNQKLLILIKKYKKMTNIQKKQKSKIFDLIKKNKKNKNF